MKKYYLWINEAQDGPFEVWEILQKLIAKEISEDTPAYEEGASEPKWIKIIDIPGIRFCSYFSGEPSSPVSLINSFESSIAYFCSLFGRVYLGVGFLASIIFILIGGWPEKIIGVVALIGTFGVSIFFMALSQIMRFLKKIRNELKNRGL
jgi:hypothetical protein